ncbi:MAG: sulfatase-like hydrolase/transferase, partial [Gemmatimonadetes bacterium]|nr:sulfatase-like hydrolase/transferase [Gemmatimonadota bacterium]
YDDHLESPYRMQDPEAFPATTHWLPRVDRRAPEALDRGIAELERLAADGGPFFLWIHLYDPHFPYDAPPEWRRGQPDPYLAELEAVDAELGRLERAIAALGLTDAVLLVTADHGEGLDDHGEDEHGILLYDEVLKVPLIARAPGLLPAGALIDEPARTVDVASTLLEMAGVGERLGAGGSLLAAWRGEAGVPGPWAYAETIKPRMAYSGSPVKVYRTADRKLIWAPRPELYDLVADPGERSNLAAEHPQEVEELAEELEDIVLQTLRWPPGWAESAHLDPEREEALRSLGYLTGDGAGVPEVTAPEEMKTPGFDPKDLVDVVMAGRDVENGFHTRARRKLERFLRTVAPPKEDPSLAPLWSLARQNLGAITLHAGEFRTAAGHLTEALRLEPTNVDAAWELVMVLNLDGRPGEALAAADRSLQVQPRAEKLRFHRAMALLLKGDPEAAREELRALATQARNPDVNQFAVFFAERIGTDEEAQAVAFYRDSWKLEGTR